MAPHAEVEEEAEGRINTAGKPSERVLPQCSTSGAMGSYGSTFPFVEEISDREWAVGGGLLPVFAVAPASALPFVLIVEGNFRS